MHASDIVFVSKLRIKLKFFHNKYNDGKVLQPNFKGVCQIKGKLHILKVKKLDVCV